MMTALGDWWKSYSTVSTRTLAFWRIALGLTAAANTIYYWRAADVFHSSDGVLPPYLLVFDSPLELLTQPWQLNAYYSLTVVSCIAFALGVTGSKWVAPLLTAMFYQRGHMIVTGGHSVIQLALIYTWLLPVCENYSVRAWRRTGDFRGQERACSSPGYPLVLFQLGVNYTFNTVNKFTAAWESGIAVERALGNSMVSSPLGHLVADAPSWFLELSTYGTLIVEGSLPLLILSPWARRRSHWVAAVLMLALHGMIILTMEVGLFGWAMLCQIPLLLARPPEDVLGELPAMRPSQLVLRARRIGAGLLLYGMAISLTSPTNPAGINLGGKFTPVPASRPIRLAYASLNLVQGWGMFAHPLDRSYVAVTRAETEDGTVFDPWRSRAAGEEKLTRQLPKAAYDYHVFSSYEATFLVGSRMTEPFAYWVLNQSPQAHPSQRAIRFATWTLEVPSEKKHRVSWTTIQKTTGVRPLPLKGALPVQLDSFGLWEPERIIDGQITDEGSHVLSPTGSAMAPNCAHVVLHLERPTDLRSLYIQGDGFDRYVVEVSRDGRKFKRIAQVPRAEGRHYRSRVVTFHAPGTVAVRLYRDSRKPRQGFINEVALFAREVRLPVIPQQTTAHMVANHSRPGAMGLASESREHNGYCPWEKPGPTRKPHWRPTQLRGVPAPRAF